MTKRAIINAVAAIVRRKLWADTSGHDWWHVWRVWQTAKRIVRAEDGDTFVVELAALLHDIADWKFHDGDESVGPREAAKILRRFNVPKGTITQVTNIIGTMSFKGAHVPVPMNTREGKIVQDADRLDAIGGIGIARVFAYGGHNGRPIYIPGEHPTLHRSRRAYFRNHSSSVNHFSEKLLLLKDRMNTKAARSIAIKRHRYLQSFLDEFQAEWAGRR